MRLIIDTDAGIDDSQAIMMALAHPGTTVEAITTSYGNVSLDKVIRNVQTTLAVMKSDVPVYKGVDRPLVADWQPEPVHGTDGLGNLAQRPRARHRIEREHAVTALIRLANTYPGELTLIALGPHTNIALATMLDPTFPSKIKKFVFMGGTISAHGNTKHITAEWNIFCDPEAAYRVVNAFPKSAMLSWETTLYHPFTWEQYDELTGMQTEAAQFMKNSTDFYANLLARTTRWRGYLLPDPLAMAITLDPSIIRVSKEQYVTVEMGGSHTRGQTVIDHRNKLGRAPNVEVITELDTQAVFGLYQQMLK